MENKPQRDAAKQEIPSLARQVFEIWFNALVKYEPDALNDVMETAWKAWSEQAERMVHECNHAYLAGLSEGLENWRWISVEYSLPEKPGTYLIVLYGDRVKVGQFDGENFFFESIDYEEMKVEKLDCDPKYWTPLPTAPQVKGLGE